MNMHQMKLSMAVYLCTGIITPCACLAVPISGQGSWGSTLQGRDLDGNLATFEAYYDTTLNITWMADAKYVWTSGYQTLPPPGALNIRMTWSNANAWAASLNPYGSGITGWRLPIRDCDKGIVGPAQADNRAARLSSRCPARGPARGPAYRSRHAACSRRRAHRPHLRGSVPPRLRLEGAAWGRLELPETRAASPGARRGGHREVEDGTLAPYKKTPAEPAERSYFSMKVASCSNRWSDALGHREARRRFCASGTVAIDCRPSVRSRLLRTAGAMACIGLSTPTISGAEKSSTSFRDCGDICAMDAAR